MAPIPRIAILSAMEEEINELLACLVPDDTAGPSPVTSPRDAPESGPARTHPGQRTYTTGTLWGQPVVLAFSRWGKVAAASTVTHIINHFAPSEVIFSGVAGSLRPPTAIGDVVIADSVIQHDLDAEPMFPRFEIPLLGLSQVATDAGITVALQNAATVFVDNHLNDAVAAGDRREFGLGNPQVLRGQIASGDQFIADADISARIAEQLPEALCVEMEGAAVGQVCYEYDIPFGVIRTISDDADHASHLDFPRFIATVASAYTHGVIEAYCRMKVDSSLSTSPLRPTAS